MTHSITKTDREFVEETCSMLYRVHCSCGEVSDWGRTRPQAIRALVARSGCDLSNSGLIAAPAPAEGLRLRDAVEAAGFAVLFVGFIYAFMFMAAIRG